MDWLFNGLPIHVLLVHFVVIVVPLAALSAVLVAAWPVARRRIGIVAPILALAALISVPITTQAGEALEEQVAETAFSEAHTHIGRDLLPWAIALVAVTALQWAWFHYFTGAGAWTTRIQSRPVRLAIRVILIVAVVAIAIGAVVEVVIIGESGAKSVWQSRLG